jgi:GGDEF domain-containing protein
MGSALVAVAKLLIIAVGVLAVPFSVHVLIHLLGDEALKSHTDPLTGLRNRRGFYRSARELLGAEVHSAEPYLTVIMLDLDRFKQVNDTRGHTPATGFWSPSPTSCAAAPEAAPSSRASAVRSS